MSYNRPMSLVPADAPRLAAASLLPLLWACSSGVAQRPDIASIAPLHERPGAPRAELAASLGAAPALLEMTAEMRDFVDRYVRPARAARQRLHLLHSSLRSRALLGIDYDPGADGTAAQVFRSGRANCLSFAHLFVAMARHAGLEADYQLLDLRPEWSRHGDQVALRQHVNVLVTLSRRQRYVVDIDPVRRSAIAGHRIIDERAVQGLHFSNLAMARLFEGDLAGAYLHAVRALQHSPRTDFLWLNLGAVYSRAGNDRAGERAYRVALALNPNSHSAMNNLMALHTRRGELEQADRWRSRIAGHRRRNPYYHAHLGERALEAGDFRRAARHFRAAVERKRDDAQLYYRLGQVHLRLGQPARAGEYLQQALAHARLASEREEIQALLGQLREPA